MWSPRYAFKVSPKEKEESVNWIVWIQTNLEFLEFWEDLNQKTFCEREYGYSLEQQNNITDFFV